MIELVRDLPADLSTRIALGDGILEGPSGISIFVELATNLVSRLQFRSVPLCTDYRRTTR